MFRINHDPQFVAAVKVVVPTAEGPVDQVFVGTFRVLPLSAGDDFDLTTTEGTTAWLRTVWVGWNGIEDDEGEAPWSEAMRDQLLDWGYVRLALIEAYREGSKAARRGN